jgi:hypothetical protein
MFVALLVVLVVGLWWVGTKQESPPDARIAQLEARLQAMQGQLHAKEQASNKAIRTVQDRRNAIKTPDFRLSLDSAMAVALDSSATIKELRVTLIKTVEQAETYQVEVLRYQEAVDTLIVAHVREREAFIAQIDTLKALTDARTPARCAIWGVPCPNRTTAFLLGVGSALVLAVAVAF